MQSDLVASYIRRLAKETGVPVYTFAHDVAASGGYVSCPSCGFKASTQL